MKRYWKIVVLALAVGMIATACTLREGEGYRVKTYPQSWPPDTSVHMEIKQDKSDGLVFGVWMHNCNTNQYCTGFWMNDNVNFQGWGAAEWNRAVTYYDQIAANFNHVWFNRNLCLEVRKEWDLDVKWGTYTAERSWCDFCRTLPGWCGIGASKEGRPARATIPA